MSQIGQYNVIKKIAEGGYGAVYKVEKDGIQYALKQYHSLDIDVLELDLLRRCIHPNIISCIEFFKSNDNKYNIILELAESTLNKKAIQNLNDDEKLAWCFKLASAILFLHDNGYNHCDLKPDNILVKNNDIKVADLGLSFPFDSVQACGTDTWATIELKYDSWTDEFQDIDFGEETLPEQKKSSDIFSIGLLFVYILTGKQLVFDLFVKERNYGISQPQAIVQAYANYILQYPGIINDLNVNNDWKELLLDMCHPLTKMRRSTIAGIRTIFNYKIFKNHNLSTPIPGVLLVNENKTCKDFESYNVFELCAFISSDRDLVINYSTLFLSLDIFYRLYDSEKQLLYSLVSVYLAIGLTVQTIKDNNHEEVFNLDWIKDFISKNFKQYHPDEFIQAYDESLLKLNGIFKNKTLYDIAESQRECVFGLFCMCSCDIKTTKSIQELHTIYAIYEGKDIISRENKLVDIEYNIFTENNITKFVSYCQTYPTVSPAIIFRIIEQSEITEAMMQTNVINHNRVTSDNMITLYSLTKNITKIKNDFLKK
jgi:serine/threonine protein kinase